MVICPLSNSPREDPAPWIHPYALGMIAVVFCTAIRFGLDPLVHDKAPELVFVCGVVAAALFGGLRGGITATLLTLPAVDYFFIEPRYTWFIHDAPGDSIALSVFLILGIVVSVLIDRFHRTRERLREAHLQLQEGELRLRTLASTVPEILFTTAPDGSLNYVSQSFVDYCGVPVAEARLHWRDVIHPDDRQSALEQWSQPLQAGAEFEALYRMRRADGEYRWFKTHVRPVHSLAGDIVQWTGVSSDVHDQKSLAQALAQRTEQLVASNEEFHKFAYRVSHDLKEPLRMIGIFTEFLVRRNHDNLDDESRGFTKYILEGVERIQSQLRDLLEYARAGSLEVRTELIDFNAVLESATDNLRSTILESGATITHDPLPSLVANADRMRSVFQNLIANALKYRGARPPVIHISARQENEQWLFSVRDNGIGFEMADADRIFAAFERLPAGGQTQGSGLGLAIVKRIVEFKGGRIWAESRVGIGSTFFFTLPRSLEKIAPGRFSPPAGLSSTAKAS